MADLHHQLTQEKWSTLVEPQQILNIASELNRAKGWLEKNNKINKNHILERVFELIDLTSSDPKWRGNKRRELLRYREHLGEFYVDSNNSVDYFHLLLKKLLQFDKETSKVEI